MYAENWCFVSSVFGSIYELILQVLVHDPYTFPLVSARGMSVGMGQETFVSVLATTRERYIFFVN